MGPPASDPATWPAHQQPLLVVDDCDRGLQVVHGHLASYLAVDLRDGQHPVGARLSGDGHHAAADPHEVVSLRESDDVRQGLQYRRSPVQKRAVRFTARICRATEGGLLSYHS